MVHANQQPTSFSVYFCSADYLFSCIEIIQSDSVAIQERRIDTDRCLNRFDDYRWSVELVYTVMKAMVVLETKKKKEAHWKAFEL